MEKPILFNTEMVRAIMEGRKTVTRRLIKPKYKADEGGFQVVTTNEGKVIRVEKIDENGCGIFADGTERHIKPPYKVGDILYVRETWKKYTKRIGKGENCRTTEFYGYKADTDKSGNPSELYEGNWKPSIHMPKEAARIFLRVTDVRVERLQTMKYEDFNKEGFLTSYEFMELWDKTIKKEDLKSYSYKANPWVWVIEFEVVTEDFETGEYIKVFE